MTGVWLALAFFAFVMTAVIMAGYYLVVRREQDGEGGATPGMGTARSGNTAERSLVGRAFESVGSLVPASKQTSNPVRRQLIAAGYHQESALAFFYGLRCATALASAAIFAALAISVRHEASAGLLSSLGGAGIGYFLPARLLRHAIRERRHRLRRALPTALDLCVLSLESGQSLDQAMLDTSRGLQRSYPDLATELQIVFLETRASNDRLEALNNLGIRTTEPEIRKMAALLADADRFGASIAPALRNHSRYLRIRMRQNAQELARKVGVKLIFPVFFLIFPSVLLVTLGPACIMVMTELRTILK